MNKLFVIHYYPIDYFPPVMNLIDSLGEKVEIRVSTLQKSNSLDAYGNKKAKIYRRFKENWKIQCKLPPKTKRFCPLVLK